MQLTHAPLLRQVFWLTWKIKLVFCFVFFLFICAVTLRVRIIVETSSAEKVRNILVNGRLIYFVLKQNSMLVDLLVRLWRVYKRIIFPNI